MSCWFALLTAAGVAACSHSEPFPTDPSLVEGPLNNTPPIRLTFSVEDDGWPSVSGDFLSYRFERGSSDRDFCAGVLPARGGQRVAEICAWQQGELGRSDDFRSLVLLADNRMAFTWHSSGTGNQSPQGGALYYGEQGRAEQAVKVLDLMTRPTGASANWTYLIDPVQVEDNAFLVLASAAAIGQPVAFGPVDTVYQGVEIAKIDLSTRPATVTSIVAATDAVGWALDRASGTIYFHRRYYSSPPADGPHAVVADTVFSVPLAGGTPVARFGAPPVPAQPAGGGMSGFAIVNGRLFVSLYEVQPVNNPPGPDQTSSSIVEVHEDGTLETTHSLVSRTDDRWGRLSATPGGTHLVAEGRIGNSRDLYLLEIDP